MESELIGALLLGGLIGVTIGRVLAENGRARADMKKAWNGRKDYRGQPKA